VKIYSQLSLEGFSNTYVVSSDSSSRCVVLDPGSMDSDLLTVFLKNRIEPETVLITRDERHHTAGLKTLIKIYQPSVYGVDSFDLSFGPADKAPDSNGSDMNPEKLVEYRTLALSDFSVTAITFPGAWIDGSMYVIDSVLFPGPMLSAGGIREVDAGYPQALLVEALRSVFDTLPKPTWIFPAYGPPTTIQAELRSNPSLQHPPEHFVPEENG